MKIIVDSDVLIKLTKIGSKAVVVSSLDVFIPKRVHEETVVESKGFNSLAFSGALLCLSLKSSRIPLASMPVLPACKQPSGLVAPGRPRS